MRPVLSVLDTRPEAIKMAAVLRRLLETAAPNKAAFTAQRRCGYGRTGKLN